MRSSRRKVLGWVVFVVIDLAVMAWAVGWWPFGASSAPSARHHRASRIGVRDHEPAHRAGPNTGATKRPEGDETSAGTADRARDGTTDGEAPWATASFEGRITDSRGSAVPQAVIVGYGAGTAQTHADRSGGFHLGGVALRRPATFPRSAAGAEVTLRVTSAGFLEAAIELDDVQPDETRRVDVTLERGGALSGRVVGSDGHPRGGVSLWFDLLEPLRRPSSPAARLAMGSGRNKAESSSDGGFEADGLVPGQYNLIASGEGLVRSTFGPFAVAAEETTSGVELVVEAGASIVVRVLDAANRPVSGAIVSAFPGGDRESIDTGAASSDPRGQAELAGLSPGAYDLEVAAEGYTRLELRSVEAGAPAFDIRLEPSARLRGRVLDATSGRPVTEFSVAHVAFRSADGSFEFGALPEKPEPLEVLADGYAPTTIGPYGGASGSSLDAGTVRLVKGGTLSGRVVDPRGTPLGGASVHAVQVDEHRSETSRALMVDTDSAGHFELPGLAPGRWVLSAGENGSFLPSGTVAAAVSSGETRIVDIQVGKLPGLAELLRTTLRDELAPPGTDPRRAPGERAVAVVSDALARVYERGLVTGDQPNDTNAWIDAARAEIPPGQRSGDVETVLNALREQPADAEPPP